MATMIASVLSCNFSYGVLGGENFESLCHAWVFVRPLSHGSFLLFSVGDEPVQFCARDVWIMSEMGLTFDLKSMRDFRWVKASLIFNTWFNSYFTILIFTGEGFEGSHSTKIWNESELEDDSKFSLWIFRIKWPIPKTSLILRSTLLPLQKISHFCPVAKLYSSHLINFKRGFAATGCHLAEKSISSRLDLDQQHHYRLKCMTSFARRCSM